MTENQNKTALVLGASGFLGSHVTRQLVERGYRVRILARKSSNTSATEDLDLERFTGDVLDYHSLDQAMHGCHHVYHCVVDTRAWLRDPAPLWKTNIEGLTHSMDAALANGVERFVYTSTFATIGRRHNGLSTEEDAFHWNGKAPDYIQCRVDAENLFMDYCQEKDLPGVACCVGNTYGERDIQPTPHGKLLWDVSRGLMPFYWEGGGPTINIRDAATGMVLACEKGRTGERYILGGPFVSFQDLFAMAARAAGKRPPRLNIPLPVMYRIADSIELVARPLGIENKFTRASIECSSKLAHVSSEKAIQELGWDPGAPEQAVKEAVNWYKANL